MTWAAFGTAGGCFSRRPVAHADQLKIRELECFPVKRVRRTVEPHGWYFRRCWMRDGKRHCRWVRSGWQFKRGKSRLLAGLFSCSGPQLSDLLAHFIFAPHEEFGGLLDEVAASDVVLEFEQIHLRPRLVLVPVSHAIFCHHCFLISRVNDLGREPFPPPRSDSIPAACRLTWPHPN